MIKILVDSSADRSISGGTVDFLVPLTLNIDDVEYKSGIDITTDEFYEKLLTAKEFPRTSQPSPQEFLEVFEQAKESGDEVICLCLSSQLSGTYQSAMMAREMVDYDGIYIVDTLSVTHLTGIIVDYARELINQGETAAAIVEKCEVIKGKIRVFLGVETLEYLYKGGRLSRASATVAEVAGIKPVLELRDGKVETLGKCLGKLRAMNFILDKVKGCKVDSKFPMYSLYTYGTENVETLEEKLKDNGYKIADRLQVGSTIGTHVGPGVYAVAFVEI
ncbi:MAG: DegV family protein [Clostridia bacterium]|nr:DegV family protein [Clostridia bacterium]